MNRHIIHINPATGNQLITTLYDGTSNEEYEMVLSQIKAESPEIVTVDGDDVNSDDPEENFIFAWEMDTKNNKLDINIDKVKEMHMSVVRQERNKKLDELDKEQLIAMSKKDTVEMDNVDRKKKELRDLPVKVEAILKKIDFVNEVPFVIPPEIQN